jgi:peptidoglycan/LPS O-acetylase OafA/YrhL
LLHADRRSDELQALTSLACHDQCCEPPLPRLVLRGATATVMQADTETSQPAGGPTSHGDAVSEGSTPAAEPADLQENAAQSLQGLSNLLDRITPWLFEVGGWVFGGLFAFSLVLMSALITVGPIDRAVRIGTAAFAAALPLNVAGIVLLKLIKDAHDISIDELALHAFQEAGFPSVEAFFPPAEAKETARKRPLRLALSYSLGIGVLCVGLALTGTVAALWHMSWWIGVLLLAMVLLGAALIALMIRGSFPHSPAEKELKRRYREQWRQVKKLASRR